MTTTLVQCGHGLKHVVGLYLTTAITVPSILYQNTQRINRLQITCTPPTEKPYFKR